MPQRNQPNQSFDGPIVRRCDAKWVKTTPAATTLSLLAATTPERGPNNRGEWRRTKDARMQTETLDRRPLYCVR
jgi:hypothetical protein